MYNIGYVVLFFVTVMYDILSSYYQALILNIHMYINHIVRETNESSSFELWVLHLGRDPNQADPKVFFRRCFCRSEMQLLQAANAVSLNANTPDPALAEPGALAQSHWMNLRIAHLRWNENECCKVLWDCSEFSWANM